MKCYDRFGILFGNTGDVVDHIDKFYGTAQSGALPDTNQQCTYQVYTVRGVELSHTTWTQIRLKS